jgi:hypothetical protein
MGKICSCLGMHVQASKYFDDAVAMRREFNKTYVTASGRVVSDSQAAIALVIYLLLPTLQSRARSLMRYM